MDDAQTEIAEPHASTTSHATPHALPAFEKDLEAPVQLENDVLLPKARKLATEAPAPAG